MLSKRFFTKKFQSGSRSDCKTVSTAWPQQDNPPNGNVFCRLSPQNIALSFSLLNNLSLVLWFVHGTSIPVVTRRIGLSPSTVSRACRYQEMGCYMRKARQGHRRATNKQQDWYLLLEEEQKEHCQRPTELPPAGYWCVSQTLGWSHRPPYTSQWYPHCC